MKERPEWEQRTRAAVQQGDLRLAASLALDGCGAEVAHFLRVRLGAIADVEDALLWFAEELWRRLPEFRWDASLRAWMFVLARRAAVRSVGRRIARSGDPGAASQNSVACTQGPVSDRIRALREKLCDDDQSLLILCIDRKLPWSELVLIMNEVATDAPAEEIERAEVRLAHRLECAKGRLRALAVAHGLVGAVNTPRDGRPS